MSLVLLQQKIGAKPDGSFGPATLRAAMTYYKLTVFQAVHFFAQVAHETGDFKLFSENLNYSAEGLLSTFKKYFTPKQAQEYARQPERIANKVYANRMGNGPESSGDGWKYRGRGALQLTGKDNYIAFAKFIGDESIIENPDLVSTKYAFESAIFYFKKNNIFQMADKGTGDINIILITKRINGGTNGLSDRAQKTRLYAGWLK